MNDSDKKELQSYRKFRDDCAKVLKPYMLKHGWFPVWSDYNYNTKLSDCGGIDILKAMQCVIAECKSYVEFIIKYKESEAYQKDKEKHENSANK